jgi:hypothetical protein
MMYPRTNYEMTETDLETVLAACKPVTAIMIGGYAPSSQQENANRAWAALGAKMGFDHMTVYPIPGKGNRFFTAVPSETEEARNERVEREAEEKRQAEMKQLTDEIEAKQQRLFALKAHAI